MGGPGTTGPPAGDDPVSKSSLNYLSAIQGSEVRKSCRNASIISVSSQVGQYNFSNRAHHLYFLTKQQVRAKTVAWPAQNFGEPKGLILGEQQCLLGIPPLKGQND